MKLYEWLKLDHIHKWYIHKIPKVSSHLTGCVLGTQFGLGMSWSLQFESAETIQYCTRGTQHLHLMGKTDKLLQLLARYSQALTHSGEARFINWYQTSPFLRECWQSPKAFFGLLSMCELWPCAWYPHKKSLVPYSAICGVTVKY